MPALGFKVLGFKVKSLGFKLRVRVMGCRFCGVGYRVSVLGASTEYPCANGATPLAGICGWRHVLPPANLVDLPKKPLKLGFLHSRSSLQAGGRIPSRTRLEWPRDLTPWVWGIPINRKINVHCRDLAWWVAGTKLCLPMYGRSKAGWECRRIMLAALSMTWGTGRA